MRLIDADKLKMTTITRWNGDVDFVVYKEELDNAPTVIAEKQTEPTDGDLISRQKVKDLIRGLTKWSVRSQDGKFVNVGLLYDDVMFGIDRLPGAEKTAEWEWVQYESLPDFGNYHCSECRHIEHEIDGYNYCPNCGRRMLGEQTE